MVNYARGKIYKITSIHTTQVYVGSTTQATLAMRLSQHMIDLKRFLSGKRNSMTSCQILELGDYRIELLELYPCESKDELHACEGKWIRDLDCVNKRIAGRDRKQYQVENADAIKARKKQYRVENADALKAKAKQYRVEHADAIKASNRAKAKQYRLNNRDKINARQRVIRARKKAESE